MYLFLSASCLFAEPTVKEITESCDVQNYIAGCDELGSMYYYGGDVQKNKDTARKYYKKACVLGSSRSCYMLGKIYELSARKSISFKNDMEEAISFYIRGCKIGDSDYPKEPRSCSSAARLIEHRQQFVHPNTIVGMDDADNRNALYFYVLGCRHNDELSCRKTKEADFLYNARIRTRSQFIGDLASGEHKANKKAAEEIISNKCNSYAEYDSKYFNPYDSRESIQEYYNTCIDIANKIYINNSDVIR